MRCLVTGGGTGGHIYPAIAVAHALVELLPRTKVLYVGTPRGMESTFAPKHGLDFKPVRSLGIRGKSPLSMLKAIWTAGFGILDAFRIIRSFKPDVVLGTGGYVSGPVVLTAFLMGVPCAIQEQNAIPGKTNLLLSKVSSKTFVAWEDSKKFFPRKANVTVSGNPIRASLLTKEKANPKKAFGLEDKFTLLVLGGSRGAKFLVDIATTIALSKNLDVQMILITGEDYYEDAVAVLGAKQQAGIDGAKYGNITIRPYIHNIEQAYRASDMVLARAGGMTLAEITALGLPSIIVPSPNVVGNHQEYNARALELAGAASVIREGPDTLRNVEQCLKDIINHPERHRKMSAAAKKIGRPNAAKDVAQGLIVLARHKVNH